MSINDIIDEALSLNPKDRYVIIDTLMSSLVSNDDLSYLENEIEKGFDSKLSHKTHEEIFKSIK
jgi:hypothetical protein